MLIEKEIVTERNNYIATFDISEESRMFELSVKTIPLSDVQESIYVGSFPYNSSTKLSHIIEKVKEIIKRYEEPYILEEEIKKWNGFITYDVTQEEKNKTLENMLDLIISALDDTGCLTDKQYVTLKKYLDKFSGIRE